MTDLDAVLDTAQPTFLQQQAAALLLYQSVLETEAGTAFLKLLQTLTSPQLNAVQVLQAYGHWFKTLANLNQSWQFYLVDQILKAENPFTQQAQKIALIEMPPPLVEAARQDLRLLWELYRCGGEEVAEWVQKAAELTNAPVVPQFPVKGVASGAGERQDDRTPDLITKFAQTGDWADLIEPLAAYYQQCGTGIFAAYRAFRWQDGQICGIAYPDTIRLYELVGYEAQKEALLKNTQALLKGYPALHVLLYGSRGSGKSSLVKSLLHQYGQQGLRLIEVPKADLRELPAIVDRLRQTSLKFIIFVDDLSFEEDDDAYKALKVVLEGNLTAKPQNVVVYATSNRRHLIREFFADRPRPSDADEVHAWDTVQEKLSFSDRFGLTLTFNPADQETYLEIVRHLAQGMAIESQDLQYRALQWATRHNGRSGRSARQFVDFLKAELAAEH
ncbi:ATP-binding protein [Leptolyngbya sp. FACHB-711]|uniref:ATP-binding protein n=1 Tax=unclassified Leptolyngbya TaxID=2650499 RepID=UPI001685F2AF|nr:ATP-binding protein [Leptolyngbya sp. FACHB-711]MBD1851576.1 ATP-binding protein [Cyanobacteria bacterium FACHB-502]MBD2026412.1 ATP-binding protein [Leptolyngbya sp. FACHB-711]